MAGNRAQPSLDPNATVQNPEIKKRMPTSIVVTAPRLAPFHSAVANPQTFEVMMITDMKSGQPRMGPMAANRVAAAPYTARVPVHNKPMMTPKSQYARVPARVKRLQLLFLRHRWTQ